MEDRGTWSQRGGIIDIFSPLTPAPFRLEFVGDEIETLRTFDPATQRSLDTSIAEVVILPVREIIYTDQTVLRAQIEVKRVADETSIQKSTRDQILEYLENRVYFSGIDTFLPFFYPKLETLFDMFSETFDLFYLDQGVLQRNSQEFQKECERDHQKALEAGRLSCDVQSLYLSSEELFKYLTPQKYWNVTDLELMAQGSISLQTKTNEDIRYNLKKTKITSLEILEPLARQLKTWRSEGQTIFFVANTQTQLKRFRELFSHYGLHFLMMDDPSHSFSFEKWEALKKNPSFFSYEVLLVLGSLSSGFQFLEEKIIFITEEEIFGQRKHIHQPQSSKKGAFITNLSELKLEDAVVHSDHGIGLYRGLERLHLGGSLNDYMLIEYADKDKLYVPLYRLNVIQRYVGGQKETLHLDKLGGAQWDKTKKRAKKLIEEIAHELLEIYAARKTYLGFSFSPPDSYFHELEATFPYDETTDQLKAISEILSDMCSSKPMDRIVCGDVGYGKTEVAIRAAFKAVMDKKQVAVLAPTTLLVDQHTRVFKERLKSFPVTVDSLSRFRSPSEQKETLRKLKSAEV
ncbi:MAG: DEAD/DEAH box helicase, partial [Deltaproteobacteria bacterium]|nr:DEAD/DEAH box helicase [Deltaproteobacteria bacterium]